MTSTRLTLSFSERSKNFSNPLAKKLFDIAERKQTNLVLSADLTTTQELLTIADILGPYIAVLKTHIDVISDFTPATIDGLKQLAERHDFLLFEDRKFVDIGNTVQKQYTSSVFQIHDWAHIVNAAVLPGPGVIQALDECIRKGNKPDRAILILAEMTSKGSLATGEFTRSSVEIATMYQDSVIGFVATKDLSDLAPDSSRPQDFITFTTGVNVSSKGDPLGQQYQTPTSAMAGGSDFLIAGRGLYAVPDSAAAAQAYREAGWSAYLQRLKGKAR